MIDKLTHILGAIVRGTFDGVDGRGRRCGGPIRAKRVSSYSGP